MYTQEKRMKNGATSEHNFQNKLPQNKLKSMGEKSSNLVTLLGTYYDVIDVICHARLNTNILYICI
jgi:hypothetical protein